MSLYDHVAVVAPGLSLDRRAALAATARSLNLTTSVDDELMAARDRLDDLDEPVPSLAGARRRVAETEADLAAHREQVATLRGRLEATNQATNETTDEAAVEVEYRRAVRELSEVETEHHAARERLADARERARRARDERDRRFRLQDRVGNLERTAREELVAAVRPAVDDAVSRVPDADARSYAGASPVSAALALVRVGTVRRPVVLACRRFPDTPTAESWLGTPVVRL